MYHHGEYVALACDWSKGRSGLCRSYPMATSRSKTSQQKTGVVDTLNPHYQGCSMLGEVLSCLDLGDTPESISVKLMGET